MRLGMPISKPILLYDESYDEGVPRGVRGQWTVGWRLLSGL